jgi:flagellar basal-body rod protein FlgB
LDPNGIGMKIDIVQDPMIDTITSYMTRLSKRQQVVASNIANIDTPGYRTKDISFHATLQELMEPGPQRLGTSNPGHEGVNQWQFNPVEAEVFEVPGLPSRPDRNNVDIDREMLKLSETSFGYSLMAQMLKGKFRTIASAINEGRAG